MRVENKCMSWSWKWLEGHGALRLQTEDGYPGSLADLSLVHSTQCCLESAPPARPAQWFSMAILWMLERASLCNVALTSTLTGSLCTETGWATSPNTMAREPWLVFPWPTSPWAPWDTLLEVNIDAMVHTTSPLRDQPPVSPGHHDHRWENKYIQSGTYPLHIPKYGSLRSDGWEEGWGS